MKTVLKKRFFLYMYKMVVKITKKTWEKYGIETLIYHNKEETVNESWQKMIDIKIQLRHSQTGDVLLKIIRKYSGKRAKDLVEEVKQKHKALFEGEPGIFVIGKLTRDIVEYCKLPGAIELRKKLGYNHDDIMVRKETSVTEEIINLFPNENIVPNKKFHKRKPDI